MDGFTLTFLSWNLAMLARSAQAPTHWGPEHTELAVRDRVLALEPDLVLFQELPRTVPYVETHDMVKANPETHQGHLATLVSHDALARLGEPEITVVAGCAVSTTLTAEPGGEPAITVANAHLAPGPAAAAERLAQLARVVGSAPSPNLAVIGDTNTRVDEIDAIADAGLGGPRPPRPTWNSRRNRFHPGGQEFTAYFTRALASPTVRIVDQQVLDEPVEADGRRFHLSDHYPLTGRIELVAPAR